MSEDEVLSYESVSVPEAEDGQDSPVCVQEDVEEDLLISSDEESEESGLITDEEPAESPAADGIIEETAQDGEPQDEEEFLSDDECEGEDEALLQYMNALLAQKTGQTKTYGRRKCMASRRDRQNGLSENEKNVYDQILSQVRDLLAKRRSSTEFQIDLTGLDGYQTVFTESEIGTIHLDPSTGRLTDSDLGSRINTCLGLDFSSVVDALTSDHPELFFWYGRGFRLKRTVCIAPAAVLGVSIYNVKISMTVSAGYCGASQNSVDASKMDAINLAAENARQIIADASGMDDYGKLKYYLDAIDQLVTYDHQAAASGITSPGADYDPWELIWVFDGDPSTNVVCEGYAKAFKYLCGRTRFSDSTIEAWTVSGTISSGNSYGLHMWDIVHMGGRNYLVDPSWCDIDSSTAGLFDSDRLFLAGGKSDGAGSFTVVWGSHSTDSLGRALSYGKAVYRYDDETLSLYDPSELDLSDRSYREVSSGVTYTYDQANDSAASCPSSQAPASATRLSAPGTPAGQGPAAEISGQQAPAAVTLIRQESAAGASGSAAAAFSDPEATSSSKSHKGKVKTEKITLTCGKKITIRRGQTVQIGVVRVPSDSSDKLRFKSSKKKVAKVSKSGLITAGKKGKAVITVRSGSKKVRVTVKVF